MMAGKIKKLLKDGPAAGRVVFALILLALCVPAGTLPEYKAKIAHFRSVLARLITDESGSEAPGREEKRKGLFDEIREYAAKPDMVEIDGTVIRPQTGWMVREMRDYDKGAAGPAGRKEVLIAMDQRLGAIEAKINEYEESSGARGSKDETKRRLAQILKREQYRQTPSAEEESLIQRFIRWISDLFRNLLPVPASSPRLGRSGPGPLGFILQITVYALVFCLVGFLVYRFGPALLKRYRSGRKARDKEFTVLGEKIAAGETTAGLFGDAERLAHQGHLREAIRKGYIALLFELGERRLVGLAGHKTNRDYLQDVRERGGPFGEISDLTSNYERHWYGSQTVESADWEQFRGGYRKVVGIGTK